MLLAQEDKAEYGNYQRHFLWQLGGGTQQGGC